MLIPTMSMSYLLKNPIFKSCGQTLGFDQVICTKAKLDKNKRVTGRLKNGNCHGWAKAVQLERLRKTFPSAVFTVYTDHHSDIPIIKTADKAVAVNPTPKS